MVTVGHANLSDREEIEKLIAEYHSSEGLLLVAREEDTILGVALAVYTPSAELGRVMTVNDFFVRPHYRRKGVGRELTERLVKECKSMKIDEIGLEVLHGNKTAAAFWRSIGFKPTDRFLFRQELR